MKILRIACLGSAIALSQLALAKMPLPNEAFGRIEGALDFCAQADTGNAAKYQQQKKVLVQGATDDEVAEARASKEYKENYDAATEEMGKQPKERAKKTCAAVLAGKSAE
jgi:hypothetical protein